MREEIEQHLNEELKEFEKGKNKIYVVLSKAADSKFVNQKILEFFIKKLGLKGIYVTLNHEFEFILQNLKQSGLDEKMLYFIDGASKEKSAKNNLSNCTYIEGPGALTELSIVLTDITRIGKYSFLLLDSINTILIYNELKTSERFLHYIVGKMRALNLNGVLLSIEEESTKSIMPIISNFCDKCVILS